MTYFEWNVGNFGQAITIPAVPRPTALLLLYTLNLKSSSEENKLNKLTGGPELFKSLFFEPQVCSRLLSKMLFLVK